MKSLVSIMASRMSSFCEEREMKETNATAMNKKFNKLAHSLCTQIHDRLGLQDSVNILSALEMEGESMDYKILIAMHKHTCENEKAFFFQEDSYFNSGPFVPVNKVSTLSNESSEAVWKYLRRLFYYACEYVSAKPIMQAPFADAIIAFLPPDFKMFGFLRGICDTAAKDPDAAVKMCMEFIQDMVAKTGISKEQFGLMSKGYIDNNLGKDGAAQVTPFLGMLTTALFKDGAKTAKNN